MKCLLKEELNKMAYEVPYKMACEVPNEMACEVPRKSAMSILGTSTSTLTRAVLTRKHQCGSNEGESERY